MHNTARSLPTLLESFASQEEGEYELEFIFVDDGSEDDSARVAADWLVDSGSDGSILHQEHRGDSAARNAGVNTATGAWITFPASDGFVDSSYFSTIARYIASRRGGSAVVVASNVVVQSDPLNGPPDTRGPRFRYAGRARNIDLGRTTYHIQLSTDAAFVRTEAMRRAVALTEAITASADAVLLTHVLAEAPNPILGLVPEVSYHDRRHDAIREHLDPGLPGYLGLLETHARDGVAPGWIADLLLHELTRMLHRERSARTASSFTCEEVRAEFLDLMGRCLRYVPEHSIYAYRATRLSEEARYFLIALRSADVAGTRRFPDDGVWVRSLDQRRNLLQLSYYFTGSLPREVFRIRANDVEPFAGKVRSLEYFGQTILYERIAWLPANSWLTVELDGERQQLALGAPRRRNYAFTEKQIWSHFDSSRPAPLSSPPPAVGLRTRLAHRARSTLAELERRQAIARITHLRRSARLPWTRRAFRDAWVLCDRLDRARDNAEHLYHHLRRNHTEINAWFVLRRDSPDWMRLKRAGFQLVAYGSRRHHLLMLNASHMVSSHADIEMVQPIHPKYYPSRRRWRFTFLGHGVTQNNISRWLNPKPIDLTICATRAEQNAFTADSTPYRFTAREAALTGLPRHDHLWGEAVSYRSGATARSILIAPTWRDSLLEQKTVGAGARSARSDFLESAYATEWLRLLASPGLERLAQQHDLRIVFLPHPNSESGFERATLPPSVERARYSGQDVQKTFAQAELLITDYSSVAFDLAYIGTPTVYFQFDAADVFSGGHTTARGYWDYERDGFGPVRPTMEETIESAEAMLGDLSSIRATYISRIDDTFAYRDSSNSERVVAAIRNLDIPVPPA